MTTTQPPTNASPLKGLFRETSFVVCVLILAAAALGLNAAVGLLQVHFKKEAVAPRIAMTDALPTVMGAWVQIAKDDALDHDLQDALGTGDFLFAHYLHAPSFVVAGTPAATNPQLAAKLLREHIEKMSHDEQRAYVAQLRAARPEAVLSVALTYYTGKADTVAHIPERCYVADGYDPVNPATEQWNVLPANASLPVRHILFEDVTGRGNIEPCNVAYTFKVNNVATADSLAVRRALQDLFQRYGYYAKIELMSRSKAKAAPELMKDFLTTAMPHVDAALPDWSQYAGKR